MRWRSRLERDNLADHEEREKLMGVGGRDQREHGFYKGWEGRMQKGEGRQQLQLVLETVPAGVGRSQMWVAWGLLCVCMLAQSVLSDSL